MNSLYQKEIEYIKNRIDKCHGDCYDMLVNYFVEVEGYDEDKATTLTEQKLPKLFEDYS